MNKEDLKNIAESYGKVPFSYSHLPSGFTFSGARALQDLLADTKHLSAVTFLVESICGNGKNNVNFNSSNETYYNLGRSSVGRDIITIRN